MSTPIKLKLNSSNELKLSVKSYGDIDSITEVALVIESTLFDYKFSGKVIGESVHIKIPKLKGIIESGEYKAVLNVVADGDKYFTPYKGKAVFSELGSVNVSDAEISETKTDIAIDIISNDDDEIIEEVEETTKLSTKTKYSDIFNNGKKK